MYWQFLQCCPIPMIVDSAELLQKAVSFHQIKAPKPSMMHLIWIKPFFDHQHHFTGLLKPIGLNTIGNYIWHCTLLPVR